MTLPIRRLSKQRWLVALALMLVGASCTGSDGSAPAADENSDEGARPVSEIDLEALGATRPLDFTRPVDTPPVDRTRAE